MVINPDSGDVRPVFTPTPDITRDMETEITRRLAAGEPLLPLLGPDLHGPMPGALTGVILSPNHGPVYVSNLGDALVRLER